MLIAASIVRLSNMSAAAHKCAAMLRGERALERVMRSFSVLSCAKCLVALQKLGFIPAFVSISFRLSALRCYLRRMQRALPHMSFELSSITRAALALALTVSAQSHADGLIGAWGSNFNGQLTTPSAVGIAKSISAGYTHSLAVNSANTVTCWGANQFSQSTVPFTVGSVLFAVAGHNHNVAIKTSGSVVCWGLNDDLQCSVPTNLGSCTWAAAGGAHTLAIKSTGLVQCWGFNGSGQCTVPGTVGACARLAAGSDHSIALRTAGTVACWGYNVNGQSTVPSTLGNCVAVAGGFDHSIALKSTGTVVCWGLNSDGQCAVPAGLGVCTSIAGGFYHTLAIRSNGQVVAWGDNSFGQGVVPGSVPLSNRIAGGGEHSMIVSTNPVIQLVLATQPTCALANGSIDVTITNGVTIAWTGPNGFTASTADIANLAGGTYNIVVTGAAGTTPGGGQISIPAIVDSTPPAVSSYTNALSAAADSTCKAPVANFVATVTATDNYSVSSITQVPVAGTLVGLGNTAVVITVRDTSNNSITRNATFTVTGTSLTYYRDQDGDGVGNAVSGTLVACAQPVGYVLTNGDDCPLDPNKLAPGACGCGVSDVDANGNGTPDCNDVCPSDLNDSGTVDAADLALLLSVWGVPNGGKFPAADINNDGFVNAADLSAMLAVWGGCG